MGSPSIFRAISNALTPANRPRTLSSVDDSRGWVTLFAGASGDFGGLEWQRDVRLPNDQALAFFAVFACQTQIAGDIAKLALLLMQRQKEDGTWQEAENPAWSPFLRKPNHFQTRQQFVESWQLSKQYRGNTYALKERDDSNKVRAQYVLDPDRVTPLVAENGDVFYELQTDQLSGIDRRSVIVPASEIIHDRMNCFFHPLVGISPLWACNLAAKQGLEMQKNSAKFFENMSRPSGVITAPARIHDETAARVKRDWEQNFQRGNIGKVAVLGDGLKYEAMATTPADAELVKQLDLSALQVCAAHGVPPFMVGIGAIPSFENVQALTQWYYDRTLQKHIEAFEALQDEGLGLPTSWRVEFDLDDLLRMDSKTQAEVEGVLVQRGISAPNESRRRFRRRPVTGGETPYLQQQNFSLAALAKRDAKADPFETAKPPAPPSDEAPAAEDDQARAAVVHLEQRFAALEDSAREVAQRAAAEQEARAQLQAQMVEQQRQIEAVRAEAAATLEAERRRTEEARQRADEVQAELDAERLMARVRARVDA